MATIADFRTRYPEFDLVDDAVIQACLDEAEVMVDLSHCPRLADYMQMSYAAHCLAKSSSNPEGADDAAGPEQSKSVDGVSVTYAFNSSEKGVIDDWFRSTSYGQQYIYYRNKCFGSGVTVAP